MRQEQIHAAVRILKREIRHWQEPVVGVVAKESDRNPFLILISTLLSLRTKDRTTREAGDRLFTIARTPEAMLKLPLKKLAGEGLFRELKRRRFYEKPSVRKKAKQREAQRRRQKWLSKRRPD